MVDEDKHLNNAFGFTNQDGDIERVSYDDCDGVVVIDSDCGDYRVYLQDVSKMIKALQMMQQYLIEQKIIQELNKISSGV